MVDGLQVARLAVEAAGDFPVVRDGECWRRERQSRVAEAGRVGGHSMLVAEAEALAVDRDAERWLPEAWHLVVWARWVDAGLDLAAAAGDPGDLLEACRAVRVCWEQKWRASVHSAVS